MGRLWGRKKPNLRETERKPKRLSEDATELKRKKAEEWKRPMALGFVIYFLLLL